MGGRQFADHSNYYYQFIFLSEFNIRTSQSIIKSKHVSFIHHFPKHPRSSKYFRHRFVVPPLNSFTFWNPTCSETSGQTCLSLLCGVLGGGSRKREQSRCDQECGASDGQGLGIGLGPHQLSAPTQGLSEVGY